MAIVLWTSCRLGVSLSRRHAGGPGRGAGGGEGALGSDVIVRESTTVPAPGHRLASLPADLQLPGGHLSVRAILGAVGNQ